MTRSPSPLLHSSPTPFLLTILLPDPDAWTHKHPWAETPDHDLSGSPPIVSHVAVGSLLYMNASCAPCRSRSDPASESSDLNSRCQCSAAGPTRSVVGWNLERCWDVDSGDRGRPAIKEKFWRQCRDTRFFRGRRCLLCPVRLPALRCRTQVVTIFNADRSPRYLMGWGASVEGRRRGSAGDRRLVDTLSRSAAFLWHAYQSWQAQCGTGTGLLPRSGSGDLKNSGV